MKLADFCVTICSVRSDKIESQGIPYFYHYLKTLCSKICIKLCQSQQIHITVILAINDWCEGSCRSLFLNIIIRLRFHLECTLDHTRVMTTFLLGAYTKVVLMQHDAATTTCVACNRCTAWPYGKVNKVMDSMTIQGCHLKSKLTHWSKLWRSSRYNFSGLVYLISPAAAFDGISPY